MIHRAGSLAYFAFTTHTPLSCHRSPVYGLLRTPPAPTLYKPREPVREAPVGRRCQVDAVFQEPLGVHPVLVAAPAACGPLPFACAESAAHGHQLQASSSSGPWLLLAGSCDVSHLPFHFERWRLLPHSVAVFLRPRRRPDEIYVVLTYRRHHVPNLLE